MGIRFSKFSNRKDNKTEVIGIVGVGRGVGTTHLGLLLANYLQGVWGRKTAVLEWNNHGDFSRFRKQCTGQMEVKECFRIQKVDYYSQAESSQLMRCMETGYQEVVIDFGNLQKQRNPSETEAGNFFLRLAVKNPEKNGIKGGSQRFCRYLFQQMHLQSQGH